MDGVLYFALWYGPQYRFAYGYMNRTEIHVTWLEKYGPCDFQYDTLQDMFIDVTHKQNWDSFVGLAMTTISKEMFEAECPNAKAT